MDVGDQEDQFRIYSDRVIDASVFSWNPHMDLLAVLPGESSNLSVSVYRLIDDKQTGSPLLFVEKVPFTPSCVSWVPDKRSLAVGDVDGNVFVYDAERQRTVELQKVHPCRIASMSWVELGLSNSGKVTYMSDRSKLPEVHATPVSVAQFFGEAGGDLNIDNSDRLVNDSLRSVSFLSVMGENGKVQIYFGGSIPVAEFSAESLFPQSSSKVVFKTVAMSGDTKQLALLAESESSSCIFFVNTSLLFMKRREIANVCFLQSEIHWLLKQLSVSLSTISGAVHSSLEEFNSQVLDVLGGWSTFLDDGKIQDLKNGVLEGISSLNGAKVSRVGKTALSALDYLTSMLLTRVGVIIDHLSLACCELKSMSEWKAKYSVLGLSEDLTEKLCDKITEIRASFHARFVCVTQVSQAVGWLIFLLEAALEIPLPQRVKATLEKNNFEENFFKKIQDMSSSVDDFSGISTLSKNFEMVYVEMLSIQRRVIASRFSPSRVFSVDQNISSLRWMGTFVELCCCEQGTKNSSLLVYTIICQESRRRIAFRSPENSFWKSPQLYKDREICVLLSHGTTASICLLRLLDQFIECEDNSEFGTAEYGFPSCFIAQKLPEMYRDATLLEVSGPRGLASVYCGSGRMITLDLEKSADEEDDGVGEEEDIAEDEENHVVNQKKKIKDLKRIDSILDSSSVSGSPASGADQPDEPMSQAIRSLIF